MTSLHSVPAPSARPRIKPLPALLVNQIAAGEVVERPASVVKELLDNALDASAKHITIDLQQGGIELIRIADDGVGIPPADLPLALASHATSKISCASDLEAIATMGFRGEALASIASVARLSIRSRTALDASAHRLDAEGDVVHDAQPDSGAFGTVVTVRNLFFNTPARRKFLRTIQTEQGHCVDVVRQVALAQPNRAFTLRCDDRVVLDLHADQQPRARTLGVLGEELSPHLLDLSTDELDSPGVIAWGLLGDPTLAKVTAKAQYLFVNGRPVRDRTIQHALQESYRGLLDPARKPLAVVYLELDPAMVDVNVHPAKTEVRFRDSGRVHSAVYHAARRALDRSDLTPSWRDMTGNATVRPWSSHRAGAGVDGRDAPFTNSAITPTPQWSPPRDFSATDFAQRVKTHLADAGAEVDIDALRAAVEHSAPSVNLTGEMSGAILQLQARPAERVLQVHDSFIVTQDEDGVLIIDQHALHERVMFEKIMDRLAVGPMESQRLLTPIPLPATPSQLESLAMLRSVFERIGVDAAPIGPAAIAVHAFPTLLFDRKVEPAGFLSETLERAASSEFPSSEEAVLHEVVDMMACKAAVKAGDRLSESELSELLSLRDRVERSSSCPHGRPTTIRLSLHDLERRFGRR